MTGGNNYGARLDNRQRGNATQLLEKYRALARDAQQAGDRVTAEYYLQYAEHYFRVLGDHRDRQPENRRGREGYDDYGLDGEMDSVEGDDDRADDGDDRARDDRPRDDRARDERPRDTRSRDDRPRDSRSRDDRPREDRARDERVREDRPREDRPREDRPREERPREDRPRADRADDGNRRDWQRDRRPERAGRERDQDQDAGGAPVVDERESLLQALPPPVSRGAARRLGLRHDAGEVPAAVAQPVPEQVPVPAESADSQSAPAEKPRRRTRKPVAEAESAE
ncbi:DUF4167 domain-containing protein [Sandarakinorhabdus sp.]|uniref:DUF4167 domain-containing protein n=1 Tax=Sandarakinorhabdus sp. TaxID=1916663 RepID=UPI0035667E6E